MVAQYKEQLLHMEIQTETKTCHTGLCQYLHYVLWHSRHVLGQDDDHSPRRLPQSFLVLVVREVRQSHDNTATT